MGKMPMPQMPMPQMPMPQTPMPRPVGTEEHFDPLWGRWGQWSELVCYAAALEHRLGEVTNLHRIDLGVSTHPCQAVIMDFDYHLLFPATDDKQALPQFSDSGNLRGHLLAANVRWQQNKHVSHAVRAEVFMPGGYYADSNNSVADFFRYEFAVDW